MGCGVGGLLLLINYFLFCRQRKYVGIVRRYKQRERRLVWVAIAIHVAAISTLLVPLFVMAARLP
jgi:hypothetical protein